MARSLRREITQMAIAVIIAIAVVYISEFTLLLASDYYHPLKVYEVYVRDAVGGIIAIGISIAVVRILRHIIETASDRSGGKKESQGYFHNSQDGNLRSCNILVPVLYRC